MGENQSYGVRCDPMACVANDQSLNGALIRQLVLGRPEHGDVTPYRSPGTAGTFFAAALRKADHAR